MLTKEGDREREKKKKKESKREVLALVLNQLGCPGCWKHPSTWALWSYLSTGIPAMETSFLPSLHPFRPLRK